MKGVTQGEKKRERERAVAARATATYPQGIQATAKEIVLNLAQHKVLAILVGHLALVTL